MEAYKNINLMHNYKLNVMPGVELHTYYGNKEIHLLSYSLEYGNPDISEYLKNQGTKEQKLPLKLLS